MAAPEKTGFDGPVGRLEALLDLPDEVRATAVVCHPHPLHQGSMLNKVAHSLARAMVGVGAAALRFNFRGVGASEGVHDHGNGEVDDALAAVRWLRERHPSGPLILCGFSFGARIAMLAALRCEAAALVTIAPAVARDGSELPTQPELPWLIVQGDADDVVDCDDVVDWFNGLAPGPELVVMSGVGHFFHGKLTPLRAHVTSFMAMAGVLADA